jgi:hypothetical protein
MPSLADIQAQFIEAIYSNATSDARLQLYRNTVFSNIINSLKNIHPVICKLVGEKFFTYTATAFIRSTPPSSGNLDAYGKNFSNFLTTFPDALTYPYLPDVAKLEWACHAAYHAEDNAPLDSTALSQITPDRLGNLVFTLNPSLSLIASPFPLYRIWEINQPGYQGEMEIDLESGASYCQIIRRFDFSITITPITQAMFYFLSSLQGGKTLYEAYETGNLYDAGFDVGEALYEAITGDVFTGIKSAAGSPPP